MTFFREKANIRQQLRLYAMDESQWTSLPFELNDIKLEVSTIECWMFSNNMMMLLIF